MSWQRAEGGVERGGWGVERGWDGWREEGKGRVEGGGGTMAHEGKVSQYYVFSPLLADKGK